MNENLSEPIQPAGDEPDHDYANELERRLTDSPRLALVLRAAEERRYKVLSDPGSEIRLKGADELLERLDRLA